MPSLSFKIKHSYKSNTGFCQPKNMRSGGQEDENWRYFINTKYMYKLLTDGAALKLLSGNSQSSIFLVLVSSST